jgi:hypothetical protein
MTQLLRTPKAWTLIWTSCTTSTEISQTPIAGSGIGDARDGGQSRATKCVYGTTCNSVTIYSICPCCMSLYMVICPPVPACMSICPCITACSMFLCPICPYIFTSLGSTRLVPKCPSQLPLKNMQGPHHTHLHIYIYIYTYIYIYI